MLKLDVMGKFRIRRDFKVWYSESFGVIDKPRNAMITYKCEQLSAFSSLIAFRGSKNPGEIKTWSYLDALSYSVDKQKPLPLLNSTIRRESDRRNEKDTFLKKTGMGAFLMMDPLPEV